MFFDEFFVQGYIIGRCVTDLKLSVELSLIDEEDKEDLFKKYPSLTNEIIEEVKNLDLNCEGKNLDNFYKNHLDLFKDTEVLIEAEKQAKIALKIKHIEEELISFFKNLKTDNLKETSDGFNIVFVYSNYSKKKGTLIESDLTKDRINLANKFLEMEESSFEKIKDIVKRQELNDSDDYSIFRIKNCVLEIRSILNNDYNLYKIQHIDKNEFWRINKVNFGESLKVFKADEYNRLIV